MRPGILVADDHALFRAGLRLLLEDSFPGHAVHEAADLDAALDTAAAAAHLALMLIDLDMPGMDGTESLAALRDGFPDVPIGVVSASERRDDVLGALAAGATGFVPKSLSPDSMRLALAAVLRGETFIPAQLLRGGGLVPPPGRRENADGRSENLTPRQREVGRLLVDGLSTKEIARRLDLGEGTVKVHLAGVFRSVGARNRLDAALKLRGMLRHD